LDAAQQLHLRELVPAQVLDPLVATRQTQQVGVVEHDHLAVAAELDVELDPVGPALDRVRERRQGVLEAGVAGAPVREDQHGLLIAHIGPEGP
jgi:hypothetical protein